MERIDPKGQPTFGAFVVTYNRPDTLVQSIRTIFRQTRIPELLLVIDNGEGESARGAVEAITDYPVVYHSMGHNSGPAGAAHFGLQWMKEKGFDWVYWGDDDNPPEIANTFERLLDMVASSSLKIGIAGAVGQRYDFKSGKVVRLTNEALTGYIPVDVMAGASYMLVNMEAVRDSVMPNPELFFGFEEFELCLKMKMAGYVMLVEGSLMKEYRIKYDRMDLTGGSQSGQATPSPLRQYYSTRNLIHIFFRVYPGYRHIAFYRMLLALGKAIFGFRGGFRSGILNARLQLSAIRDGFTGRLGRKM